MLTHGEARKCVSQNILYVMSERMLVSSLSEDWPDLFEVGRVERQDGHDGP